MATTIASRSGRLLALLLILPGAFVAVAQAEPILKIRTTEFTRFNEAVEMQSSTSYNARGMAPLYEITNRVIDLFVDENPIPDGKLRVDCTVTN